MIWTVQKKSVFLLIVAYFTQWLTYLRVPRLQLRTVPTIVIAHTLCAFPDSRISYRQCLLIQGYFCAVLNYPEKVDLSKYSWYPKRKSGVTMHF